MDPASDAPPTLLFEGVDSGNPAWHPTEDRIVIVRCVDGESQLYSIDPTGQDLRTAGQG